ncbi:hypothetical protein H0H92_014104 [Tricholoma furcatifolium]|nr:hypothetical protein H0H92_014104 [Tricholoma furcatifolium]
MKSSALLTFVILAVAASASPAWPIDELMQYTPDVLNLKAHIKNVVVLVMENRSLDNLLGGQTIKGLENSINNGPFCNPYNLTDASEGQVCSAPADYDSILDDPDHAVYGNNIEFYGTFVPDNDAIASGQASSTSRFVYDSKANKTTLAAQVMNYYTEEQVPVLTELVQNFVTFNHWHSDIAGPTGPNRAAVCSGTSYGHGTNDDGFSDHVFPQMSIFQQLTETGHSWINYYDPAGGTGPDAGFFNWTFTSNNTDKLV